MQVSHREYANLFSMVLNLCSSECSRFLFIFQFFLTITEVDVWRLYKVHDDIFFGLYKSLLLFLSKILHAGGEKILKLALFEIIEHLSVHFFKHFIGMDQELFA